VLTQTTEFRNFNVKENHPEIILFSFNTTETMENKLVYARKRYLSASLYGFSYGSEKEESGVFLLDSAVENDPQTCPLIYLISLDTFLF